MGDDTGRLPRVRDRRPSPWLVIALTLLVVLTLALLAVVTVPARVPALRAPAALIDRCCAPRPPLPVASLLPAVTPQPSPEGIPA